jgi:peptide deformylase
MNRPALAVPGGFVFSSNVLEDRAMRRKGTDRHLVSPTHPALKQACRPVDPGEKIDHILDLMERCCKRGEVKGAGLAAPQIGQCVQIIYIAAMGSRHGYFLLNPVLVSVGDETDLFNEGCLSFPNTHKVIRRSTKAVVDYTTVQRAPARVEAEGWHARVLQHELDHLRGVCRVGDNSPADGELRPPERPAGGSLVPLVALAALGAMYSGRR